MSSGAVCCVELARPLQCGYFNHEFLQSHLENHLYEKILACLSTINILGGKREVVARV